MNLVANLYNVLKWRSHSSIKLGLFTRLDNSTFLEGNNRIGRNTYANGCSLGRHSYIGTDCILNKTEIGRYCSIGDRVIVITGNHPINQNISTSPVFYSPKSSVGTFASDGTFEEYKYAKKGFYVTVGNDVWIASDVRLFSGVTIGDGAIIGTGAIVTHDVEPYSINVGIPAKKTKSRFNEEIIELLMAVKWWNWDENIIKERALWFQKPEEFIRRFGEKNGEIKRQ